MESLDYASFAAMLKAAAAKIEASKAMLTELDSKIGDGDHGTTMAKVMELVAKTTDEYGGSDIKGLLSKIGAAILSVGGGATVPLFGSFFGGMGRPVAEGASQIDAAALASSFASGSERLLKFSKASPGDKTLVDALVPAVEAMKSASRQGDIAVMLEAGAKAAAEGSLKTRDYVAKHGRAMQLGDRAIGVQDPGSVSMSLIFRAFADSVKEN